MSTATLLRGIDQVDAPAYGVGLAAYYLGIPKSTVGYWCLGLGEHEPIIRIQDTERERLSFRNLIELHVLNAFRRKQGVPLKAIRSAVEHLSEQFNSDHPLADVQLESDGASILYRELDKLFDASNYGQVALEACIKDHLRRIRFDEHGIPRRLFPFTRIRRLHGLRVLKDGPEVVAIDPTIQFGRPSIVGTWTPTAVIADRFFAGETMRALAKDYRAPIEQIREAITYEKALKAA